MRLALALLLCLLMAASGTIVLHSPWSYAAQDRNAVSSEGTSHHLLGTDELGRDREVRTAAALLLGMAGSIGASALATMLAVGLGVAAALAGSWAGKTLLYLGDLFLTLPWIFLLMMVRSSLPLTMPPVQSAALTFFLLGILGAPAFLRVHYTRTRALLRSEWLLQSRAAGLRRIQTLRQLFPHLRPLFITQFLLYIPACIIAEANLGTLGLGVSEPLASWGSMLQSLQSSVLTNSSRMIYLPIALLVVVLTCLELLAFTTERASR